MAQQVVFWLPHFTTIIIGGVEFSYYALLSKVEPVRSQAIWFALLFLLVLIGSLRESALIPLGDPFVDFLVAYVPFTAAGICLLRSATSSLAAGNGGDRE